MAAAMGRVTAKDLIDSLKQLPEHQIVGYIMTISTGVTEMDHSNQCILLHDILPGMEM